MSCANPERINNGCMIYREDDKCSEPDSKTKSVTLQAVTATLDALRENVVPVPVANSEPEKRKLAVWRGARGRR